jgi:hypothetical protein
MGQSKCFWVALWRPQMGEILRSACFFHFFGSSGSRTGRTERRTDVLNGSNDADWRKEVPLGGLVSMQKRLGGPNSPKTPKTGPVKRKFQPKRKRRITSERKKIDPQFKKFAAKIRPR